MRIQRVTCTCFYTWNGKPDEYGWVYRGFPACMVTDLRFYSLTLWCQGYCIDCHEFDPLSSLLFKTIDFSRQLLMSLVS
jgi:hypothetical protein